MVEVVVKVSIEIVVQKIVIEDEADSISEVNVNVKEGYVWVDNVMRAVKVDDVIEVEIIEDKNRIVLKKMVKIIGVGFEETIDQNGCGINLVAKILNTKEVIWAVINCSLNMINVDYLEKNFHFKVDGNGDFENFILAKNFRVN